MYKCLKRAKVFGFENLFWLKIWSSNSVVRLQKRSCVYFYGINVLVYELLSESNDKSVFEIRIIYLGDILQYFRQGWLMLSRNVISKREHIEMFVMHGFVKTLLQINIIDPRLWCLRKYLRNKFISFFAKIFNSDSFG